MLALFEGCVVTQFFGDSNSLYPSQMKRLPVSVEQIRLFFKALFSSPVLFYPCVKQELVCILCCGDLYVSIFIGVLFLFACIFQRSSPPASSHQNTLPLQFVLRPDCTMGERIQCFAFFASRRSGVVESLAFGWFWSR